MSAQFQNVLVLGPSGAGKSQLLQTLCKGLTTEPVFATLGVDYFFLRDNTATDEENALVARFNEVTGSERFTFCVQALLQNSIDSVFLVTDLSEKNSLHELAFWATLAQQKGLKPSNCYLIINQFANKCRQISDDELTTFVQKYKIPTAHVIEANAMNAWSVSKFKQHYLQTIKPNCLSLSLRSLIGCVFSHCCGNREKRKPSLAEQNLIKHKNKLSNLLQTYIEEYDCEHTRIILERLKSGYFSSIIELAQALNFGITTPEQLALIEQIENYLDIPEELHPITGKTSALLEF